MHISNAHYFIINPDLSYLISHILLAPGLKLLPQNSWWLSASIYAAKLPASPICCALSTSIQWLKTWNTT